MITPVELEPIAVELDAAERRVTELRAERDGQIEALLRSGQHSQAHIARMYGIAMPRVNRISHRLREEGAAAAAPVAQMSIPDEVCEDV